jgi:hypothetical protein
MRKSSAVKMKQGTLVIFEDGRKSKSFGDRLGRIERVTPNSGVYVTPVHEIFGDEISVKPIGPAEWLPYSKVQLAYPPS